MKQLCFIWLIFLSVLNFACDHKISQQSNLESNREIVSQTTPTPTAIPVKPPEYLIKAMKSVEPFFKPMGKPKADEWLATFKENGQTFDEYINSNPNLPTAQRKTIYVQPIGSFNARQLKIINLTAEYMEAFYGLPVKVLPEKKFAEPLSLKNYRVNQSNNSRQIKTSYVLDEVLQPSLPENAAALIAFTSEDLYTDKNFRYVFGQAELKNRVGVWSLFRLDDNAGFDEFLRRTLKIAVHETGHIFSFAHCTKYVCVMSGVNHLGELYQHPIDACPECMAKICWMSGYQPKARYEKLAEFCRTHNLKKDFAEFNAKSAAVGKN